MTVINLDEFATRPQITVRRQKHMVYMERTERVGYVSLEKYQGDISLEEGGI